MQDLGDNTVPHTGSMLMGTVLGSIKLITQIPQVGCIYAQLDVCTSCVETGYFCSVWSGA